MKLNETVEDCLRTVKREIGGDGSFVSFRLGETLQSFLTNAAFGSGPARVNRLQDTLCMETITSGSHVALENAAQDPRFSHLDYVQNGAVTGYLASPVKLEGEVVGTICAISRAPRAWRSIEVELMKSLARILEASLQAELRMMAVERFATSLSDMDSILAILAGGMGGPAAIFDKSGTPVFYTESLPPLLDHICLESLGHEAVAAYESSLRQDRLKPGESLDFRHSHFDLAVVKASEKFYYCSMPRRAMTLH